MRKKSVKVLSFILTAALILSFIPSAIVSAATTLPTGNAVGRLTDGLTVSYGDGNNMDTTGILTDGFYYSYAEAVTLGKLATAEDGTKMITLTNDKKVIEFNWEQKQSVKRLEMWIWKVGAVNEYEIQVFNGNEWITHEKGSFDQTTAIPADNDSEYKYAGSIFYLAQFKPVTTNKLRFVVKSFGHNETSAKIAEVIPRSTDMVNLLADDSLLEANLSKTKPYKHNETVSSPARRVFASPYAWGFACSAAKSLNSNTTVNMTGHDANIWPYYAAGNPQVCITNASGSTEAFYRTTFMCSPQKINLVKISSAYAGTYKKAALYYSNSYTKPKNTSTDWVLAKEITGTFSQENPAVISIPGTDAPKAMHWKVVISGIDGDVRMLPVEMYSLADGIEAPIFTGSVERGSELSFNVFSYNKTNPDSVVLFALYEDGVLDSIAMADMPLDGIKEHSAKYTVPVDAEGKLSVKAFFWNLKTLVPILNTEPLELREAE